MKDLVIAPASNYEWKDIQYWINSILRTGFDGDIVITGKNISKETIDKVLKKGIDASIHYQHNSNVDPNVERFFFVWNHLKRCQKEYRYVVVTDIRDVVFQLNPSKWLEQNLKTRIVASSEELKYKNETWNTTNYIVTFDQNFYDLIKDVLICNAGVIAGLHDSMTNLMALIYQMCIKNHTPYSDQSIYNFLINTITKDEVFVATNKDAWAAQLGVTLDAILCKSGEIGQVCCNPYELAKYKINYEGNQPIIDSDGIVKTSDGNRFTIVHQWDRVHSLRAKIDKLYGD